MAKQAVANRLECEWLERKDGKWHLTTTTCPLIMDKRLCTVISGPGTTTEQRERGCCAIACATVPGPAAMRFHAFRHVIVTSRKSFNALTNDAVSEYLVCQMSYIHTVLLVWRIWL